MNVQESCLVGLLMVFAEFWHAIDLGEMLVLKRGLNHQELVLSRDDAESSDAKVLDIIGYRLVL